MPPNRIVSDFAFILEKRQHVLLGNEIPQNGNQQLNRIYDNY